MGADAGTRHRRARPIPARAPDLRLRSARFRGRPCGGTLEDVKPQFALGLLLVLHATGCAHATADEPESTPTVTVAESRPVAPYDPARVRHAVESRWPRIRICYDDLVDRVPDAGGRVVVEFVIATDGTIATSRVAESAIEDATFQGCLLEVVRGFRFPPRGDLGVVQVRYPFEFTPGVENWP